MHWGGGGDTGFGWETIFFLIFWKRNMNKWDNISKIWNYFQVSSNSVEAGIFQTERHPDEFKQAKRCNNGCFPHVSRVDRNLKIARDGRAFLQCLCSRAPAFLYIFFSSRSKVCISALLRSKFCFGFLFRTPQLKTMYFAFLKHNCVPHSQHPSNCPLD